MLFNNNLLKFVSVLENEVHLIDVVSNVVYAQISHDEVARITFTDTFFEMPVSYEQKQEIVIMLFDHARSIAVANKLTDIVQVTISLHKDQPVRAMAGLLMCASSGMAFS